MIRLTRYSGKFEQPEHNTALDQHSWPIRVTASSTEPGLGSAIFVMQRGEGLEGFQGDTFAAVASLPQMSDLGLMSSANIPFYRTSTITVHCRSAEESARFWTMIQTDVADLLANHRAAGTILNEETVEINTGRVLSSPPSGSGAAIVGIAEGDTVAFKYVDGVLVPFILVDASAHKLISGTGDFVNLNAAP